MNVLKIAVASIILSTSYWSQCGSVAYYGSPFSQRGIMFAVDNVSANSIIITGIESRFLGTGPADVTIYSVAADFAASASNLSDPLFWGTPVAVVSGLEYPNASTPITDTLQIGVPPGTRRSFYVTCTNSTSFIVYTSGNAQWNTVVASDGIINLIGGNGKSYPLPGMTFGGTTPGSPGRLFNGEIRYYTDPYPGYDTNTLGASLDVNGKQGSACVASASLLCIGEPTTVQLATAYVGAPYELAFNSSGIVSLGSGALLLGATSILNLDLSVSLAFLNGSSVPLFLPHPGTPIQAMFTMPRLAAPGMSAQLVILNGTSPDGFECSQPINLQGFAPVSIPGPMGNDTSISLSAGVYDPLTCFTPPEISLYGTSFTQYHVTSNGRVVMGPMTSLAAAPAGSYGAAEPTHAGCYADFFCIGGSVEVSAPGGDLQVDYNSITYVSQVGPMTSFSLLFSPTTSNVTISNINLGVTTSAATGTFIGVHPGGSALIDPVMPPNFLVPGMTTPGSSGYSHGVFSPDLIAMPLTNSNATLTFTFGLGGYTVAY